MTETTTRPRVNGAASPPPGHGQAFDFRAGVEPHANYHLRQLKYNYPELRFYVYRSWNCERTIKQAETARWHPPPPPSFFRCHFVTSEKPSAKWDSVYRASRMKNSSSNVSRWVDYKCSSAIRGEASMGRKKTHALAIITMVSVCVIVMVSYNQTEVLTKAVYCSCPFNKNPPSSNDSGISFSRT